MHYYYLALGSNIYPEDNILRMIALLAKRFGKLLLYPAVYTKAEHMPDTSGLFLNSLVILRSELSQQALKQELRLMEAQLGRDLSDPQKHIKDRTADIDILTVAPELQLSLFEQFDAPYIQQVLLAVLPYQHPLLPNQHPLTQQQPTTIDSDRFTRYKAITHQKANTV